MPKINKLPQNLVNRIAAGEIVERPASIVKELLENSLDAGAKKIDIEIEDGGKKLIRISDDGCGIDAQDLHLAFAPHATSKIASDDDLLAIATMGFRGEALPSIASVSQVEIITRPASEIEGARLEINAGIQQEPVPTPAAPGTVITVRNIFFNTPARRKFLRTTNTEMSHITEQFIRIALANNELQLSLTHNGRKVHDLPAGQTLPQRISELFSKELADALFTIKRQEGQFTITGLAGHPRLSRTGSQGQYVFLNRRFIRDRYISHAVREAYRGMLEINRQPIIFLFLQIPFNQIDVNVHPAKTEVRFADSNFIHSQVLAAVRDQLLSSDISVPIRTNNFSEPTKSSSQATSDTPEHQQRVRQAMTDFFKSAKSNPTPINVKPSFSTQSQYTPQIQTPSTHHPHLTPPPIPAGDLKTSIETTPNDEFAPVIQIHNSFIITQAKDGLLIIDQHALHERILYEKLSRQLNQGPLTGQRRLIPEVIDVTAKQLAMAEEKTDILNDLGIIVEQFGPRSLAVQCFPVLLEKLSPADFVSDMLDMLIEHAGRVSREELIHHILDMMACKAAVKAGDTLSDSEIKTLLAQRTNVPQAGSCPHGRPTTITLSINELEKLFKRT